MTVDLRACIWPSSQIVRALETLMQASRLAPGIELAPLEATASSMERRDWLVDAGRHVGIEGVWHTPVGEELEQLLADELAMFIPLSMQDESLIVVARGRNCRIIGPEVEVVCQAHELAAFVEETTLGETHEIAKLFRDVPGAAHALKSFRAVSNKQKQPLFVFAYQWDGSSSFWKQFHSRRGHTLLLSLLLTSGLRTALLAIAGLTLGRAALDGVIDVGRILAWTLVSLACVPLTYWSSMAGERLAIVSASVVKARLLEGAFFVDEDDLRRQGYGAALARLNEAGVVERVGVSELFGLITPLALLVGAIVAFASSGFPASLLLLVGAFVLLAVALGHAQARGYAGNYINRLRLTEDVIDKIIGHRTRAIQQGAGQRHLSEDRELVRFAESLERLDAAANRSTMLSKLWALAAAALLLQKFVSGADLAALLPAIVGVFLATAALSSLSAAYSSAAAWIMAWRAVSPLFRAGTHRERKRRAEVEVSTKEELPTVLAVSSLSFGYRLGGRLVLKDSSTRIARGEKVLLEGPSGGGKSTFAKLVAGELRPSGGTMLVGGLDARATPESQWREVVASTPQFHENHIFSDTLAFNVDPRNDSIFLSDEARVVVEELGLTDVIHRMPSGPAQIVGETGWQLSHGERSRVFVARSLLQSAKLIIFDESFAALDPFTLASVVKCVRKRAETLIVIAHT